MYIECHSIRGANEKKGEKNAENLFIQLAHPKRSITDTPIFVGSRDHINQN